MVDVRSTVNRGPQEKAPEHMRNKRRQRRLQILKDTRAEHGGGLRIVPASEALRGVLKHPNGTKFRSKGSIEWPNDRFTQRRLRDGSVKIEAKKQEAKADAPISKSEATNLSGRPRSQAPA
jgi:hypothetical protein